MLLLIIPSFNLYTMAMDWMDFGNGKKELGFEWNETKGHVMSHHLLLWCCTDDGDMMMEQTTDSGCHH